MICGDEQGPPVKKDLSNLDQLRREALWGNLMGGGGGVEWYCGYQGDFGDMQSEDFRVLEPLWQQTKHAVQRRAEASTAYVACQTKCCWGRFPQYRTYDAANGGRTKCWYERVVVDQEHNR